MTHDFYENLLEAADAAIEARGEGENHLSVTRRVYHDGTMTWFVVLSDSFMDFSTHFTDDASEYGDTAQSLSQYIALNWDEEWDEKRAENPSGDEGYGSSDWK